MEAKNATEVLIAAKWILENVGWIKGQAVKYSNGKYQGFCANSALSMVKASSGGALSRAHDLLQNEVGYPWGIVHFNDKTSTTKKMVLDAFDKAIEKSRK